MILKGKTRTDLEKEQRDKELTKIVDDAQAEAEEMLQSTLRRMALDKLIAEGK